MARLVPTRKSSVASSSTPQLDEPPPLSRSQVHELNRRVRDLEDRTRYLLVSAFTAKHALYYDVSEDVFAMNAPSLGTLFKRRSAALAIQVLLRSQSAMLHKQELLEDCEARYVAGFVIWLRFRDGTAGEIDLGRELYGTVFEPLLDPAVFGQFQIHPEFHTLTWPNGADFAPEFLHDTVRVTA